MSGMMGMQANTEDMFVKLDGMRSTIQEVNSQFQDPVSQHPLNVYSFIYLFINPLLRFFPFFNMTVF